jgi:hypothetical protein
LREKEFVHGDASRVVKWIEGEVEAFDDLLSSPGLCLHWGSLPLYLKQLDVSM